MHCDLIRLKLLLESRWGGLVLQAFDERRRDLDGRLRKARKRPSEKRIHNLRVASRRMLSMLEVVETTVPRRHIRPFGRSIRKRLKELRRIRDVQVQLGHCDTLMGDFPQLKSFQKSLQDQELALRRRIRERLESFAPRRLETKGEALLDRLIDSIGPAEDATLGTRINLSIEDSWHRVLLLKDRVDPRQIATIHAMRLAFKRFRYMAEIVAPVIPHLTPDRLTAMHDYQDRMGAIQDLEVLLGGMMVYRRRSGRTSILVPENEIRRRRQRLVEEFVHSADELRFFWSAPSLGAREVV